MNPRTILTIWRKQCLFDREAGPVRVYRDLVALRIGRRYEIIDAILDSLDVNDFASAVLVGVLTATTAACRELAAREGFYHRVQARLEREMGVSGARERLVGLACEEGWAPVVAT